MRRKLQTYALTIVCRQRRRLFQRTLLAERFITTIFHYRDSGKFLLHAFVVMPDHIHIVLSPAPEQTIERCVQLIKGGFSFATRLDVSGEVWQAGYHAHRVIDNIDLGNQVTYIERNPARRQLYDYPHVHTATAYRNRLDSCTTFVEIQVAKAVVA